MNYEILLKGLQEAGKNPFSFVAYVLIIVSWTASLLYSKKLNIISKSLKDIPENQRLSALKLEYNIRPKGGLTSFQFLEYEKRKYFLIAFILTLVAVIIFIGLSTYKSVIALQSNIEQRTIKLAFDMYAKGTTSEDNKKWESAIQNLEASVAEYPTYIAYMTLTDMYDNIGDSRKALNSSVRAMQIEPANPKPYMNIGMYYSDLDNFDSARYYLEKSLSVFRESKKQDDEFLVLNLGNLGNLYSDRAEIEMDSVKKANLLKIATKTYFEPALNLKSSIQKAKYLGKILGNAGNSYRILGNYERSHDLIQEAISVKEDLLHKSDAYKSLGFAYLNWAELNFAKQDYTLSKEYCEKALEIFSHAEFPLGIGYSLMELGDVLEKTDKMTEAKDHWEKANRIFVRSGLDFYSKITRGRLNRVNGLAKLTTQ
jgi:tetratricopeptide (TPR) repeat protein